MGGKAGVGGGVRVVKKAHRVRCSFPQFPFQDGTQPSCSAARVVGGGKGCSRNPHAAGSIPHGFLTLGLLTMSVASVPVTVDLRGNGVITDWWNAAGLNPASYATVEGCSLRLFGARVG